MKSVHKQVWHNQREIITRHLCETVYAVDSDNLIFVNPILDHLFIPVRNTITPVRHTTEDVIKT
jgi:hypothetical protein